jgi:competence protein ComGC
MRIRAMKMLNNKARSLVAIMITVAFIALFLRFSIGQVVNLNIAQNESNARETVKLISTAIENYAKDHRGVFPASLFVLIETEPSYIDKEYITHSARKGYNFNFPRLDSTGYTCSAVPIKCSLTGRLSFAVATGGTITEEECSKKE